MWPATRKKKLLIETEPEITEMMKLAGKDFKEHLLQIYSRI